MGVFDRFFRRKGEVVTEEVAAADLTEESGAAEEAEPVAEKSPEAAAVEIPKQLAAPVAADSETGEGART
ncbi:gliding motility protein [Streptomyces virginiae]|uniref:gliding motility protein n=1 Tax=Streptomyces virginiae TaxID=1961 RepID=UPI002E2FAC10|nr:gliding motility protein [Streptomyces virginiae]